MLYDKQVFNDLVKEMNLELDPNPDYDAAVERMQTFYPDQETNVG